MTVGEAASMTSETRPRCFFDVTLGGLPTGRIVFELFSDVAPKTVDNFRALCTGEKGNGIVTGKPLHYKNTIFHRVVKDFMVQSGDFSAGNGTGGESIYGGTFEDENFSFKHDRPFLLSMANRGKNTNGSQFFITTQPTPHLDNIHVVFGHVISGQDLVRQLEQLPVDRNSRPLQDAVIASCGELVRHIKVKKDKKKKKRAASSDGDSSSGEEQEKPSKRKDKKMKKRRKHSKSSDHEEQGSDVDKQNSTGNKDDDDEVEEGELHPLVTVTKIDPDEIPEVSNNFLMRARDRREHSSERERNRDTSRERRNNEQSRDNRNAFGWSKKRVPTSRSGRAIKGRGVFRFRTPSRSRSRSITPPHWKRAQNRIIKLSDLERLEEEKKVRDEEIKRREVERKKRHEEMAKDPKKSFYELSHASSYGGKGESPAKDEKRRQRDSEEKDKEKETKVREKEKEEREKEHERERDRERQKNNEMEREREKERASECSAERKHVPERKKSMDMNALDYEDHPASETEMVAPAAMEEVGGKKLKPPKEKERASRHDHRKASDGEREKDKEKPKEREKQRRSRERSHNRSKSRSVTRSRSRSRSGSRRRHSPSRDRRDRDRFVGRRRGFRSPPRRNFRGRRGGNNFMDRRRRSRSADRYRNRFPLSPIRDRRSPIRSRDVAGGRNNRSQSRSPRRDRPRWRRNDSRDRSRERRTKSKSHTPGRQRRNKRSGSRSPRRSKSSDHQNHRSRDRTPPKRTDEPTTTSSNEGEKDKAAREKMQKRAEALQMFKDHMRKEIAKEEEKRAEKQRQEDVEKENTARELEELERLKAETLQKLEDHEKLKKLTAMAAVAAAVTSSKEEEIHKEKDKKKKRKKSKKHIRSSDSDSN